MRKKNGSFIIVLIGLLTVQSFSFPQYALGELVQSFTDIHGIYYGWTTVNPNRTILNTDETLGFWANWTVAGIYEYGGTSNPKTSETKVIIHTYSDCNPSQQGSNPGLILWSSNIQTITSPENDSLMVYYGDEDWYYHLSGSWSVSLQDLALENIAFTNGLGKIYISVWEHYYSQSGGVNYIDETHYCDTAIITLLKKSVETQVYEYKTELHYGDSEKFNFIYTNEQQNPLVNQLIQIEYEFNSTITYSNQTTDSTGSICFSVDNLNIGSYELRTYVDNSNYFYFGFMNYSFEVSKIPIYYDLIGFSEILYTDRDLDKNYKFTMWYYYFINGTLYFLNDYDIDFELFTDSLLLEHLIYRTNSLGLATFVIPVSFLQTYDNFRFQLIINGTSIIQNKFIEIPLIISTPPESERDSTAHLSSFPFIVTISMVVGLFMIIFYNTHKKSKLRNILELVVRY